MSQSLGSYFVISAALLSFGVFGLLCRRNLVAIFISLELILNSASINFIALNKFCFINKVSGQIFTIFIIALAAAEVCIGLSFILWLYRRQNSINVERAKHLRG